MSDLPLSSVVQQHHAHAVSGEQLEMLGKRAAALWADGEYPNLTSSVTCVVKEASPPLSPEQVRRVVEFANVEAYLTEFRKEGAHKIVDFGPDGPANPADVLRDLNDGGGTTVMDSGLGDYHRLPEKHASAEADALLESAFSIKAASVEYPEENPYGEVIELRDKVASAYENTSAQINGLEVIYADLSEKLYDLVKQAALQGTSLGEIVQAWSAVNDNPVFVKAAFDQFVPRLFNDGVFSTLDEMGGSISKTAGARLVNVNHPLVDHYNDFCQTLEKLAGLREYQEDLRSTYEQATQFLAAVMRKEAGRAWDALGKAERAVTRAAEHVVSRPVAKAVGFGATKGAVGLGLLGTGVAAKHMAEDLGEAYNYRRQQRRARWAGFGGEGQ